MTQFIFYPSITEPISTSPESVHVDAWQQPLSLPQNQWAKILSAAIIAGSAFMAPNAAPEAVHVDAWQQPLSLPIVAKHRARTSDEFLTPFVAVVPAFYQDAWARDLSQPTSRARAIGKFEEFSVPNTAAEASHPDAWARDLSRPTYRTPQHFKFEEFQVPNPAAEAVHPDAWARNLSQPTYRARFNIQFEQFEIPNPAPEAVHFDAFTNLQQPRQIPRRALDIQNAWSTFTPSIAPIPSVAAWGQQMAQPIFAARLTILDVDWTFLVPVVPPTPPVVTLPIQTYFVANMGRMMNRRGG